SGATTWGTHFDRRRARPHADGARAGTRIALRFMRGGTPVHARPHAAARASARRIRPPDPPRRRRSCARAVVQVRRVRRLDGFAAIGMLVDRVGEWGGVRKGEGDERVVRTGGGGGP